ncbi:MAG TPA: DUF5663 domain-containing protein [Candidatus Paceibacterota bacterium]|nr:DUF5663 domain-containing protein [Candidatus Paceibacterota bacterium]
MTTSQSKTLLDALDLATLPEEDQEEILLTLNDLIFRGSLVRLIERMDDAEREAFSGLVGRDVEEGELLEFLKKIPGSEDVVKETVDELTNDILSVIK